MELSENKVQYVKELSYSMRLKALEMAYNAGETGAHLGGGLSCIEIMACLYGGVAKLDKNPLDERNDHILISKAHAVLAYYTALQSVGYISEAEIQSFEHDGTILPGHPLKMPQKGIDYAGGSLGMALSVGAGMALHDKKNDCRNITYVLLGDGECEEGAVYEAAVFATHQQLDNLVAIVDRNHLQYDGTTEEVAGLSDYSSVFEAMGWETVNVNGHCIEKLLSAFSKPHRKPLAVIASTIKGKGVSFMENNVAWHHAVLNEAQYNEAVAEVKMRYSDAGYKCEKQQNMV
jgi:transketolase